jgi:hypothetical protein
MVKIIKIKKLTIKIFSLTKIIENDSLNKLKNFSKYSIRIWLLFKINKKIVIVHLKQLFN